jgi:hypothetical protein
MGRAKKDLSCLAVWKRGKAGSHQSEVPSPREPTNEAEEQNCWHEPRGQKNSRKSNIWQPFLSTLSFFFGRKMN